MGPGGIATIIASCALMVIAVAIAYVVIRVGRLVDEAKASLKALTESLRTLKIFQIKSMKPRIRL